PDPEQVTSKPRHSVYTGVPFAQSSDIGGPWFANGKVAATTTTSSTNSTASSSTVQSFTEFFTLTNLNDIILNDPNFLAEFDFFAPLTNSPAIVNAYFVSDGRGPGYTNFGMALVSIQKRLSIVTRQNSTEGSNSVLRAVAGSFNVSKGSSSMKG